MLGFRSLLRLLLGLSLLSLVGCIGTEADEEITAEAAALRGPAFPIRLSANRRYLVDRLGVPFLMKEISAWGLIQSMPESEAGEFMDAVKAKGFNTLLVSVISNDRRFAGLPPTWSSIFPFLRHWDFSSFNQAYFEHVDRVLRMAQSKGLLVALVPCYLGFPGDATQGWADAIRHPENNLSKSLAYGRFIGKRYRSFSNIMWVAGGDNSAQGDLRPHLRNVLQGIRQYSFQLWTGHFDASSGHIFSTDNKDFASYMDVDGLYAWTEAELGDRGPQYKLELERYGQGKPIMQLDQSYEEDKPYFDDNLDPQWIRRKNYDGLLSGCTGTSFSPGTRDNQLYTFKNWRPLMNTQGMLEAKIAFSLFDSRRWHELVPDVDSRVVTAGRGTFGSRDYACAARTSNGNTAIVYVPSERTLTLDMSQISGGSAVAWWFDPQSGSAYRIGYFPTRGAQSFTTPDAGDWVLVVDDATRGFFPPGSSRLGYGF